jgi:PEP-CTERM motif-containing protein
MRRLAKPSALAGGFALCLGSSMAGAHLVDLGQVALSGQGFGNIVSILEVQSVGNDPTPGTEAGDVSPVGVDKLGALPGGGTPDDASSIAVKTKTVTFGEIGVTKASDFQLIFNATEPGGNSISLDALRLTVYDPTGAALKSFDLLSAINYPNTITGQGKAGFGIGLSSDERADFQSVIAANNRIGLQASLTNFAGGPEDFSVRAVPEPGSVAMIVAGLLGIAGVVRRRTQR